MKSVRTLCAKCAAALSLLSLVRWYHLTLFSNVTAVLESGSLPPPPKERWVAGSKTARAFEGVIHQLEVDGGTMMLEMWGRVCRRWIMKQLVSVSMKSLCVLFTAGCFPCSSHRGKNLLTQQDGLMPHANAYSWRNKLALKHCCVVLLVEL